LPPEEESDYSAPVRVLQTISTVVLPLALLAFGHLRIFAVLNPDFQSAGRLTGLIIGVITAMVMVLAITVVRLRLQGLTLKSVMMKALQQPSWSRSWYPNCLRRRGDVWDRLPRRLRQFRTVKGLLLTYMFAVFLPLQLTALWGRQLPTLRRLLWGAALAGLTLMFALRQRAVKNIQTRSGATAVEASALLIAEAIDLVVHLDWTPDRQRVVSSVREVVGFDGVRDVLSNEVWAPGPDRRAVPDTPLRTTTLDRLEAAGLEPRALDRIGW